jgi:DinB superfamily
MNSIQTNPKYPIGEYQPKDFSLTQVNEWLVDIKMLPQAIELAIQNLNEQQLHTPYREGGWTVHELVHHIADSHMNAYCRFKLGLTENIPTIKPYDENAWTTLNDVKLLPINISITLLHALHARWFACLKTVTEQQWQQCFVIHPQHGKQMSLFYLLGMYAWHGRHHTAHITSLRRKNNW